MGVRSGPPKANETVQRIVSSDERPECKRWQGASVERRQLKYPRTLQYPHCANAVILLRQDNFRSRPPGSAQLYSLNFLLQLCSVTLRDHALAEKPFGKAWVSVVNLALSPWIQASLA